jgi:hypothetical protein
VRDRKSKPCVWIADAKYANFVARIAFSGAIAPTLKLAETQIEEVSDNEPLTACRLPAMDASPANSLELVRRGTRLTIERGTESSSCELDGERLALAVCGSELGNVALTQLSVTRTD